MRTRRITLIRVGLASLASLALVAAAVAALPALKTWWKPNEAAPASEAAKGEPDRLRLAGPDTLTVPPDVARHLGLRTAEVRRAAKLRPLPPLAGSLALDPGRLSRVHARFAGEVVAVGTFTAPDS